MQYIGARYVPRFMGTYDNTQVYEALDVVDNGLGTSYIAKIPTPAGTPLTNTTYWALYGASSGAIVNLQNQIDDMKDGTVPGSLQEQINTNASGITALTNLIKEGYVTPEMFGAVGDGITDDTNAVKAAIDNGGNIYVKNKYLITDVIKYTKPMCVFGEGEFIITSGKPLFFVEAGNTIKGIRFEGFTIKGDGVTFTTIEGSNMGVIGNFSGTIDLEDYTIRNVKFIDVSFGIYLNANNGGILKNVIVENCYFKNIFGSSSGTGDGIAIANNHNGNDSILIQNNYFDDCGRHALYCSYARGVVLAHNSIVNHGASNAASIPNNAAINIARSTEILVDGNYISKCRNIAINITAIDGNETDNIKVINNTIENKTNDAPVDVSIGSDNPDVNGHVRNVIFDNNILISPNGSSLLTLASGVNIAIRGNLFELKNAVDYSRAITMYAYGTNEISNNYIASNNIIISDESLAHSRGITLQNDLISGTSEVNIYNNKILATQKIVFAGTLTNNNIHYAVDPISSSPWTAQLSNSATLADVIDKVNFILTGMKDNGMMLY